jgi:hypothetical protein
MSARGSITRPGPLHHGEGQVELHHEMGSRYSTN